MTDRDTELADVTAERDKILAELSDAHAQLRDADAALRSVMTGRDDAFQRAADLQTRWEAVDVQLRHLRLAFENAARERDELTLRLLLLEQQLAGVPRPGATVPLAELTKAERRVKQQRATLQNRRGTAKRLRAENRQLRQELELAATRVSLPRRMVRRLRARRPKPSS